MDQNNTPDSWDGNSEGNSGDMNKMADALTNLNVNASPFVPGQNVFAREFVPFIPKNSQQNDAQGDGPQSNDQTAVNEVQMDADTPPDEWDVKGEESGSQQDDGGGGAASTPSDDVPDAVMEEDEEEEEEDEHKGLDDKDDTKSNAARQKRKDHLNIVFIGHVDAGKSTIGGHIMYLTGQVEKRTLEKYEKEAKEKNRETWYLSWALDTNLEERDKGKTVEVGRAYFETENKHFTILDAPGHKSFVPNMIGGASQADVAVLVISARRGEFETGFERGGQTREHAMLVKTAGVKHLVVVVNKMDDPTVQWELERYCEIKEKLTPYLKKCGFNPKTDVYYLPVSGQMGTNLKTKDTEHCPWYSGPSLLGYLDGMSPVSRIADGPVRLPVVDRYKDMGTIVLGKLESGRIYKGQTLILMPNKLQVEVDKVWAYEEEAEECFPGENVKLKLKNVEEDDVSKGFVLCSPDSLCHIGRKFDAQIVIIEHKSIICAGYSAVMHLHTSGEEVSITHLLCLVDRKTTEKSKQRPRFIKQDQIAIVRLEATNGAVCLEAFKEFPQMGRFTLRDEGRTIAIGKVLKVIS